MLEYVEDVLYWRVSSHIPSSSICDEALRSSTPMSLLTAGPTPPTASSSLATPPTP
jgi:hypothetical protein